jgi:hypothetical protein
LFPLPKEEEGKCKQLCVEVVGEWMRRETERLAAEAREEEDKERDKSSKNFLGVMHKLTDLFCDIVPTL